MGWLSNFWRKERVADAERSDGLTTLAVKGNAVVNDIVALMNVQVALDRIELPREFGAFEAMGDSFMRLARRSNADKTCDAIIAEWQSLKAPLRRLYKKCAVLPKDSSETAKAQCERARTQLPVLISRLDGIVTQLRNARANRKRAA
jgi:hypothetical protein